MGRVAVPWRVTTTPTGSRGITVYWLPLKTILNRN